MKALILTISHCEQELPSSFEDDNKRKQKAKTINNVVLYFERLYGVFAAMWSLPRHADKSVRTI